MVLVTVVFVLALLPVVKVNLSVQGTGIIRPVKEKTEVKSLVTEIVEQIFVKENQFIEKNTPILQLRTDNINSKLQFLLYQKKETFNYVSDLSQLVVQQTPHFFRSQAYRQEYLYFQKQTEELRCKRDKTQKEFDRNKPLLSGNYISEKDFDDIKFQYTLADNEYKTNLNNQLNKWQSDLNRYQTSLTEIESNIVQLNKEREFYTVRAPVSGTVEQFSGIYPGSSLRTGETVVIISPDSSLISEIYLSPRDIGYINGNNAVKIQVDAFNYNEWGILRAKVKEVSSDFMIINNSPMFRVRCAMDKTCLYLKNGIKGSIRKGMTVRARFIVSKKSLFQLLYQGFDDWLNPVQYNK